MVRTIPRTGGIFLLLAIVAGAVAAALTLTRASAVDGPDLHVHTHDESVIEPFADDGNTATFSAFLHNDGNKPARDFVIKVAVPSLFPATIQSVVVKDAPLETTVDCKMLSSIAAKCTVDFLRVESEDIELEITLVSADIESDSANGAVIVSTKGPANDDPAGQRNKHKFGFTVVQGLG